MVKHLPTVWEIQVRSLGWEDPWRRKWQPTPVCLAGKSHGQRSLVGYSPYGCEESDTTERLHFHFSLSCTGEGNGNPLQCSYLENPRDGGAWWAAVHGAAQSQTQLKQLSSSKESLVCTSHWKFPEFRKHCGCVHTQLRLTFCDSLDFSPADSSLHGILQARILEWVAISSSRGSSQPRD